MNRHSIRFFANISTSVLLLSWLTSLHAQQAQSPTSLYWSTTDGSQYLEANGSDLHLKPRTDGTGPGVVNATAKLSLPDTQKWQVSFDIRYGVLRDQASWFLLVRGGNDIGRISADGFYKQMGVFIGKDNEVAAPAADTEWHHFNYISNGSNLIVLLDNKQVGAGAAQNAPNSLVLGNGQDMRVPCHQEGVWIRNISVNDETQPALPHSVATVDIPESEDKICCVLGDSIHIQGQTSGQHRLTRRRLEINDQPFDDKAASPNDNGYSYDWKPTESGAYTVSVKFTLQQPYNIVPVKQMSVLVLPKMPLTLAKFPDTVPSDTQAVAQPTGPSAFQPSRVQFFLNGQDVGTANQAPYQIVLPVSKISPGSYPVTFRAYDAQGMRFNGEVIEIKVPERAQLTSPSSFTIVNKGDSVPFSVNIASGLKVRQVNYFVGDQQIASTTDAPYKTSADLFTFKSGSYPLKAQITVDDGTVFTSPVLTMNLANQPDDARLAKLAKEEADRQARLAKEEADKQARLQKDEEDKQARLAKQMADTANAKAEQERVNKEIEANLDNFWPRPGFDEKVFRKQAAALAYYIPEKRYGQIGKVHGLSVLVADGVPQFGLPLTVSASVRPGTGQTNFLAFSEEDAKITAQQAAEYCKTKTSYYHWDWSKYDLTVGYLENDLKNGGPSAGAADALAMMSAILNTPVDTSVAITGAVTLQGQVEPVGGVGLKVESAFADTNVHTVIVPADAVSVDALSLLYITQPKLCFNRRVIMARTMDDVMLQSLISWNMDSEVRVEKLVQGGLRHFANGEDKLALAAFAAAKQITPGNWTADFWTAMVYAVEKQSQEDAALASGR